MNLQNVAAPEEDYCHTWAVHTSAYKPADDRSESKEQHFHTLDHNSDHNHNLLGKKADHPKQGKVHSQKDVEVDQKFELLVYRNNCTDQNAEVFGLNQHHIDL